MYNNKVMKYIQKITALLGSFFVVAQFAFAQCSINGETVPCSEIPDGVWAIGGVMIGLVVIIGLLATIFWVVMLVRAITHDSENKVVWILVIILGSWLGAIIYYFVEGKDVKKKALAQENNWQNPVSAPTSEASETTNQQTEPTQTDTI